MGVPRVSNGSVRAGSRTPSTTRPLPSTGEIGGGTYGLFGVGGLGAGTVVRRPRRQGPGRVSDVGLGRGKGVVGGLGTVVDSPQTDPVVVVGGPIRGCVHRTPGYPHRPLCPRLYPPFQTPSKEIYIFIFIHLFIYINFNRHRKYIYI